MGRNVLVEDEELMTRLSAVFRDVGYAGASLAMLSEATGLKKASLYHRFPEGKEQMAREVLESAGTWLDANILSPLKADGDPEARLKGMTSKIDKYYSGGKQACLLNMLSSAHIHEGPFVAPIKAIFEAWISALSSVLRDAGFEKSAARSRAERAVITLQGCLVFSRGMGTTRPFKQYLKSLSQEMLA